MAFFIHACLSPQTNLRTDEYGGRLANRMRFAIDVTEAGIATMAVGLTVHPEQAEAILQSGQADLIALARELICNPHWPMDAAQEFGLDPDFSSLPPPMAHWLERRRVTAKGVLPSTCVGAWSPGSARRSGWATSRGQGGSVARWLRPGRAASRTRPSAPPGQCAP